MNNSQVILARCLAPRHKAHHLGPALPDDIGVIVGLPDRPRTDHARIAPRGAKIPAVLEGKGAITRERAVWPLRLHDLSEPFGVKGRHVCIERGAMNVNLCVAHPTKT